MAGPVKSAPLETFLTTVSPSPSAPDTKPSGPDQDVGAGARAVILTILARMGRAPDPELRMRSELGAELYQAALRELVGTELIETQGDIHSLTPAGQVAAERERERLLSSW